MTGCVSAVSAFWFLLWGALSPDPHREFIVQVEGDQLPPGHTVSQYETCKIRTIKAGTLEKLVENLLTAFGDNDFTYISIFLSTYRGFASTKEVLELLLDR